MGAKCRSSRLPPTQFLGVPHCVAVSSCTSGLLLVLRALALKGEVILPSFTFHATAHSVAWNGLQPVFADCDARDFCIDVESVRRRISARTAAVVAVHIFGCPARALELEKLCGEHSIPLLFDAAHAFGSTLGARQVGTFGIAEVFSFSPTKVLVAGEGGLVATRDPALARRLRAARNYGDAGNGDPELVGVNARMSELHAALALSGWAGLEQRIARRNQIRSRYRQQLETIPGISFQEIPSGSGSTCKDFALLIDPIRFGASRDSLQKLLADRQIETRRYFWPPVHRQKLYRAEFRGEPLLTTDCISGRILNLPIHSSLSGAEVDHVARAVQQAFVVCQGFRALRGSRVPWRKPKRTATGSSRQESKR